MRNKQPEQKNKKSGNIQLANQLKARLFDKGFSYGTLPSVKRQIKNPIQTNSKNATLVVNMGRANSNSQTKIIKQQSSIFRKQSLPKNKFQKVQQQYPVQPQYDRKVSNAGISRVPSAQKINQSKVQYAVNSSSRVQLKTSKSAYRIMSSTMQQFSRNESNQTINIFNNNPLERAKTAKGLGNNQQQMRRTRLLMDKISGKNVGQKNLSRPDTAVSKIQTPILSEKMIKLVPQVQLETFEPRPKKQLDRYIQLILKNVAHVDQFVYLKKSKNYQQDPYDLQVIDYGNLKKQEKNGLKQYFTISKKGLCYYYQNNPRNFQSLNSWLQQRSTFDRIKSLNFFKQFRKWKTLKMWNKTILRQKITAYSIILRQKLFFLNENLRDVILSVRQNVICLEDMKIIGFSSGNALNQETTFTLDKFRKLQNKNRQKIRQAIKVCSSQCRDKVKLGFKKNIDILRSEQKPFSSKNYDDSIKKLPKNYTPSSKQAAYQRLNFPDNMDYQMRSKLRSQCMRFIRFSYFLDFLTMSSLKKIYDESILQFQDQLQNKSSQKQVFLMKQQAKQIRSTIEPVFCVNLQMQIEDVPPSKQQRLEPYMPPPTGTHTISDFRIISHVTLKVPKKSTSKTKIGSIQQPDSQYQQITVYKIPQPADLAPIWLQLVPSSQSHHIQIVNALSEGLDTLQCFQRWSKHPDMKIYIDVLQQWDDKVSDQISSSDIYLHPDEWIDSSQNQRITNNIKSIIDNSFQNVYSWTFKLYEKYLKMYWENNRIDFSMFTNDLLADPSDSIQYSIQLLCYQKQLVQKQLPILYDKQLLRVNAKQLKSILIPFPTQSLNRIFKDIPVYLEHISNQINSYLSTNIQNLNKGASNVADFVEQMKTLKRIQKKIGKIKQKISFLGQVCNIIDANKGNIIMPDKQMPKKIRGYHSQLLQSITHLDSAISKVEQNADKNMVRFAEQISKNLIPNLNKQITKFESLVSQKKYLTQQIQMGKAIQQLQSYDQVVKKFEEDSSKYRQYQITLNMPETRFQNLADLRASLNYRLDMWRGLRDWISLTNKWMGQKFQQIDVEQIKQISQKYTKIVNKCSKKLPVNPILQKLKVLLKTFKDTMPVVIALSNKIVQQDQQYWGEIQKIVNRKFVIDNNFTLQNIIQMNFHQYQNQIIQISTQAKQQQVLKVQIDENTKRWQKLQFTVKQYKADDPRNKQAYVLDKVDQLYAQLDQILANFSGILGNRYLKRQRIVAEELQKTIYQATLAIDDWLIVQKNWIYLQNIFASNDIKVKLRQQNTKFQNIDKNFKAHMRIVNRNKLVNKHWGPHQFWIKAKDVLAQIQKQLQKYLQQKRNQFPRFYFLSNDQLIQILAKANQIDAIQKNIKKCFQCVGKLNLQGDTRYIQSVSSLQGQVFKINKTNISAKGQIEQWMKVLQHSMDQTLKKNVSKAYIQYDKYKNRLQFIQQEKQSQVILVISQINWTLDTQALLQNLNDYYNLLLRQLSQLTAMIRDPNLDGLKRKTLIALITQDVHNRDIVQSLLQIQNGVSKDDFIWTQQLRFYMKEGENYQTSVTVKQVNAEVSYGYEYLGVMSRLVITPLTDRCWMTIIGAINIKLGAAPAGPAGTGKTQSTKDLAKGLGMLCVVFNCSQQIQYKIMGRLFSGLAQQGAWSCLDQFNRIDIEVLSVIAQQLLTIRVAKLRGDQQFYFIDRNINLKAGCGVFITMNPGYAGRTELPDNLKVLFRSVSMMIPNYRLIAQIMLFAQGFEEAKVLSKKMVQLYKLSSEQLSQQDHYDFGMRAVKSVLVMAGSLKRADKQSSQQQVLIKAMRNSNIPKFLKQDLPLFEALISDLFPHAEINQSVPQDLEQQIKKSCSILKLQQVPGLTKKAIQLFDTFNVRFGVMIVGQTTSGKTKCYQVLAHSMTSLRKKLMQQNNPIALSRSNYKIVKTHCLNPKAISMGQLYGEVNQLTQQWNDGLASSIMRQCTNEQDTANCMNWVVFDGPVDALWIQNMNTVLDDNMMLCLANGERIKLLPSMRMLFQVMDLKVASPATVSRCGMVYMITQQLGWKPQVNSWLDQWIVKMLQVDSPGNTEEESSFWLMDMRAFLMNLFQKSIDSMHKFINKKAKQPIQTMPLQLARSLINLFQIFCSTEYGYKPLQQRQYKKKYLTYSFAYAFIWSLCVTSIDKYHEDLSFQCRGTLQQIIYPNNDLVQNFFFDPTDLGFKHWNERLTPFVYSKQQSFHQIIVQTIDTIRYSSIINILSQKTKPILITGPSGTGKSVQLSRITHAPLVLTSTTSHYQLQLSVQSKLDKLRKNMLGAANGTFCIVAIDDTNMPAQQQYGAIPAIEVLRSIIDKKGVWDRKERFWKYIQNTSLVCACSPPGGGRNQLTPRFTRHFNVMCLPQPSHSSLMRIYKQILDGFFTANQFYQTIRKSSENLVNATIQIYTLIKKQKLPIPSKFHYTFNLRDVSKICQGLLEARKSTIRDVQSLGKLWFHQVARVLKDRLNTDQDHHWLQQRMHELLQNNFRVRSREKKIYFSNILKLDTKQYEELPDLKKVIAVLNEIQDDHNSDSDTKLNLVFFNEAVQNILKIHRILSMARGNALLIGVSGSGKQSLTRLSSYINSFKVEQIEITKGFNIDSFRSFVKTLMKKCSNDNISTTFLFTDNQIVSQLFLEDLNNILNSGQIPNLWQLQQWQDIINTTRPFNAALKRPESRQNIYRTFVERVRERLHVVLSMSPIGDALRIRCRKFPAIVNCCTINWFFPWPQEALMSVASAILDGYEKFPTYQNIPKRSQVIEAFADICKQVHLSANSQAIKFELALKRKVYTTPKSYLDMLKLYLILLEKKQNQIFEKRDRLAGGLDKLQQASVQVADLDVKLKKLQPELQMQNVILQKALIKVRQDSQKARQIQSVVSAQAEQVAKQKNDVQLLADQARQRLKQVQPQLQRAKKAVQTIDRKALQTVRSFVKPPAAVEIVMQGVCILFGIKGDWQVQKKLLIKLDDFISSLKNYDKDKIPQDRLLKLRKQIQKSQFKQDVLFKKARQVMQIAQWCKAIQKYAVVAKQIQPKKKKMVELQAKLDKANKDLQQKMKVLNEAQQKVQLLKNQTDQMIVRKKDLERQLKLTKDRLVRAADLIRLTKDEAIRWKQTVQGMRDIVICVPTDVFLCSAAISYNGPFTGLYRKNLIDYWTTLVNAKDLPISEDFQIIKTLGDPLKIRDWIIDGLPSDSTSLQNAIFAIEGNRWPLVIDPQSQATKWMLNKLSKDKKVITKLTNTSFQQDMKSSIKNGVPVLIFDIQNTLPAVLDPIFAKQIKIVDNMPMIRFADQTIYYDSKFQLFMFTKAANPNFLPEIFIRVNIINFTVTFDGLQEQLLATVVKHERQQIQVQKDENIVKMGQYKKKINESQLNILRLLQKAKAQTILDNTQLIETLQSSQQASTQIKQKIKESQQLQQIINKVRAQYQQVSTRGSVLFFVIKDLSLIDSMYQYSLQYIEKIFNMAMDTAQKSQQLQKRLNNLINNITKDIYKNVTRGLFQKDKMLFSFMIATSINKQARVISEQLWAVFVKGPAPTADRQNYVPNPSKKLFSQRSWDMANFVQNNFAKFTGLLQSFSSKLKLWQNYIDANKAQLPDDWQKKLDLFERLIIQRILRPQRVGFGMSNYIIKTIGQKYLEAPNVSMRDLWKDSDNRTPIIFVLSPGADPTASLLKFKAQLNKNGVNIQLQIISLGQGQGGPAQQMINRGKISGKWVLLQNCHLARTFMPSLQKLVQQNLSPTQQISQNFRLFLTSMPASYFPSSVLQNGIKLTTQAPKGLKANLKRSWNEIDQQQLGACAQKTQTYHKILWGLTFFHAIIQQRQKFGPLGWNIKYQFNESDLQTSKTVLQMLLQKSDSVPFEALQFVTGQINYGGRVTDDWDRRCLLTILRKFYNPAILQTKYKFSNSPDYYIPQYQNLENYRSYIETLPLQQNTIVFGMHQNANITYLKQQQKKIMGTLLILQPRQASGAGKTSQQIILQMVSGILERKQIPELLDINTGNKTLFERNQKGLLPSLTTFLLQQIHRFNRLLKVIKNTLQDLKKAIKGLILMSDQLDSMFYDLLVNKVPKNWAKVAYPCLKPLASWIKDLRDRVQFLKGWLESGSTNSYWLSSFFFPQGFLTGVLQQHARQPDKQIPIDQLVFSFKFTEITKQLSSKPAQGVYISGLILQGGSWDVKKKLLVEPQKNQMYCLMPIVNFIPIKFDQKRYSDKFQIYECPVYKTSVRAGVLSTTGQSTNFVLTVEMPSLQESDNWVLQGTALLLQLND